MAVKYRGNLKKGTHSGHDILAPPPGTKATEVYEGGENEHYDQKMQPGPTLMRKTREANAKGHSSKVGELDGTRLGQKTRGSRRYGGLQAAGLRKQGARPKLGQTPMYQQGDRAIRKRVRGGGKISRFTSSKAAAALAAKPCKPR